MQTLYCPIRLFNELANAHLGLAQLADLLGICKLVTD